MDAAAAPLGKLSPDAFARLVAPHLGAARAEVAVGPRPGHDAAIVRIGAGRVMAVTTDPITIIPALGLERSARLACHLVASDLWTTGIPPAWGAERGTGQALPASGRERVARVGFRAARAPDYSRARKTVRAGSVPTT